MEGFPPYGKSWSMGPALLIRLTWSKYAKVGVSNKRQQPLRGGDKDKDGWLLKKALLRRWCLCIDFFVLINCLLFYYYRFLLNRCGDETQIYKNTDNWIGQDVLLLTFRKIDNNCNSSVRYNYRTLHLDFEWCRWRFIACFSTIARFYPFSQNSWDTWDCLP